MKKIMMVVLMMLFVGVTCWAGNASFIGLDRTTGGNWKGKYGNAGAFFTYVPVFGSADGWGAQVINNLGASYPNLAGKQDANGFFMSDFSGFAAAPGERNKLQVNHGVSRTAKYLIPPTYEPSNPENWATPHDSFITTYLNDAVGWNQMLITFRASSETLARKVSFYLVDSVEPTPKDTLGGSRRIKISIEDENGNVMADSGSYIDNTGGVYVSFSVTGSFKAHLTSQEWHAELSAIFVDPADK
ncbi:MAG: hypothetical protein V2A65_06915 [Candidatus Omnitrophota bacterium]